MYATAENKGFVIRIKNKDTEIIHTTEKITVSAPKIILESGTLNHQS